MVNVIINGEEHQVRSDVTVLTALADSDVSITRTSVTGESRGPLCGMGVCFECRVTINGRQHCRACMTMVEVDMEITTDGD